MLLYVRSSIAIILMGKRELVALLNLSSWCLVMVEQLFLAVPRGCLQFVIVVFPDHAHYFRVQQPGYSKIVYNIVSLYLKSFIARCSVHFSSHQYNVDLVEKILSRGMGFPTMWYVRPAKPQISLHIRAV